MARVKIYSTATCPICDKAKNLLQKWGIPYEEIRVDTSMAGLKEMSALTKGARTVPQIAIDDKWIGGFSEMTEMHMDGELDELVESG
ncbi:MAG: glutaredoxin domain-containing protein [Granulosicoccaceae bacterium]|jgi:glutaredoxin 3